MLRITLTADTNDLRKWANEVIDRLWADIGEDNQKMWRGDIAGARTDEELLRVCRMMLASWKPFDILGIN